MCSQVFFGKIPASSTIAGLEWRPDALTFCWQFSVHADKGKDIELRHQRNPDVTFDCVRASKGAYRNKLDT